LQREKVVERRKNSLFSVAKIAICAVKQVSRHTLARVIVSLTVELTRIAFGKSRKCSRKKVNNSAQNKFLSRREKNTEKNNIESFMFAGRKVVGEKV
jgi:hypothetical protein